jgi:MipA family protein
VYKSMVLLSLMLAATPATAQMLPDRDALTIGIGAGAIPSYEGSNNYRPIPAPVLRGRVAGFGFQTIGTHLYVDLWRDGPGKLDVQLGPVVGVNPNRTGQIGDARVRALGTLDLPIEAGGFIGVTRTGIDSPFDALSVGISYQRDVTDTHDSSIVRPQITYLRPLNLKTAIRVGIDAEIVGRGYARTYFGVTPAGAAASGLQPYNLGGGIKDIGVTFGASRAVKGDLRKGISLFGVAGYTRVLGDFADSPVVRTAGTPNQVFASAGIAWSF